MSDFVGKVVGRGGGIVKPHAKPGWVSSRYVVYSRQFIGCSAVQLSTAVVMSCCRSLERGARCDVTRSAQPLKGQSSLPPSLCTVLYSHST